MQELAEVGADAVLQVHHLGSDVSRSGLVPEAADKRAVARWHGLIVIAGGCSRLFAPSAWVFSPVITSTLSAITVGVTR
jgi:hypothetical protein